MTALVNPDERWHASWAAAIDEFGDETLHGAGDWLMPDERFADLSLAGCRQVVEVLLAALDPDAASGRVPDSLLWIVDEVSEHGEVVGFLSLRHRLNDFLLEQGGHIGYSIRPSRRREGHATRALSLAVRRAAGLGLDRVLVTCDEDNLASARTIERCEGVLEDTRHGKRRYWIATPAG